MKYLLKLYNDITQPNSQPPSQSFICFLPVASILHLLYPHCNGNDVPTPFNLQEGEKSIASEEDIDSILGMAALFRE